MMLSRYLQTNIFVIVILRLAFTGEKRINNGSQNTVCDRGGGLCC